MKYYGKIKSVKFYPYLSDKDMMLATGKWYQRMWLDIKLFLKRKI